MENNRFYVYVYLDQRKSGKWTYKDKIFEYQPFYVGKGTGKRDIVHFCPFMLRHKTHKSSTIKSIIREKGELPLHIRIYEGLSELDAVSTEKDFIKTFGRRDLGSGILCNHTDGGDGLNNPSLESRKKINKARKKRVYQYSMDGIFIKEWSSLTEVGDVMEITDANISTAIKRGGTCSGFLWAYQYLGEKIEGKIKYQMPVKYKNIKQISLDSGDVVAIHKTIRHAVEKMGLTNRYAWDNISGCINGTLKSACGYFWSIEDAPVVPKRIGVRNVIQMDSSGNTIHEYSSLADASRKTNIEKNTIWMCCNGRGKTAGGFRWRYKNG